MLTPEDGAKTQTFLSASPKVTAENIKGKYYIPTAKLGAISALAADSSFGKEVWDFMETTLKKKNML